MSDTFHPFEKAGLGQAPFRYVGIEAQEISYGERVIGSVGGCTVTTKVGGTCAYCRKYIVNMFVVESADGQRFHVGCDCIHKVDAKLSNDIKKDVKATTKKREQDRIAAAKANVANAFALCSQPHPNPYHASQGKTMKEYVIWLFAHSGTAGKLRASRIVEAAMAPIADE